MDAEKMAEAGAAVLSAAFALYPEIARLVAHARAAGSLSESTLAAVRRLDPPGPLDAARRRISEMDGST